MYQEGYLVGIPGSLSPIKCRTACLDLDLLLGQELNSKLGNWKFVIFPNLLWVNIVLPHVKCTDFIIMYFKLPHPGIIFCAFYWLKPYNIRLCLSTYVYTCIDDFSKRSKQLISPYRGCWCFPFLVKTQLFTCHAFLQTEELLLGEKQLIAESSMWKGWSGPWFREKNKEEFPWAFMIQYAGAIVLI